MLYFISVKLRRADVAELADAQDSGSCGKPCGFESLHPHQKFLDVYVGNFFIQTARFGISSRVGVHIIKAERLVYRHGGAVYLYLLRFDDIQLFELMICSLTTDDIQVASNLMKKTGEYL